MNKQLLKEVFGWGVILWLIGYVLGFILFFVVPISMIGWVLMPVGIVVILWVLLKKIKNRACWHYVLMAIVWTLIAVVCDYLFLVKLLKPADGYYKLDVYVYYALTFLLPLVVGWNKNKQK